MTLKITKNVLEGYLNCKYKGRLQLEREEGRQADYERMVTDLRQELRSQAMAELPSSNGPARRDLPGRDSDDRNVEERIYSHSQCHVR